MRGYFAQMRRAGFAIGVSAGKLAKAMIAGRGAYGLRNVKGGKR